MILDKALELSAAQVVTVTAKSSGTDDLGPNSWANNSKGSDDPTIPVEITVDEAVTAAGAATVSFSFRSSPNADMSSATVHRTLGPIGKALLIPGWRGSLEVPWGCGRYFDILYTVATGPLLTGKFSAQIATGRQTNV